MYTNTHIQMLLNLCLCHLAHDMPVSQGTRYWDKENDFIGKVSKLRR